VASMVSSVRGLAATEDHVQITRGSQMALDLVARLLIRPGDAVAVEALGYRPAWGAFQRAGAKLVPVPVDREGLDVGELSRIAGRERIRAVYVTPHHQYPTTCILSAARRLALLELAHRERIAIVEDDYDHEFHYDGRPVLPLASADSRGVVVYIGTLSKILAPGLRLGFVVAPKKVVEALARTRFLVDRQGDQILELAIAELIEDGEVERHARRMRRHYHARRDALAEALRIELGALLSFEVPPGGMALWADVALELRVAAFRDRCREKKVAFLAGRAFSFEGEDLQSIRLGFAALDEGEIVLAASRMKQAAASLLTPRAGSRRSPSR
jgi:GntR family transcriptional regulator / MocR family aminotransferase